MSGPSLFERYHELQRYVGWTDDDAHRVANCASLVEPEIPALIDDFYREIESHPDTLKVITGGPTQIERLKGTLRTWVAELFAGRYDEDYAERRWRVGWRHVEIGLAQVYTNVAMSRLRTGLTRAIQQRWSGEPEELWSTVRSLNRLLDLDLAIIEDAYQTELGNRLQRTERLATLGQIAGGVAHELRNPLNVVRTSVYYLLHARNATPEKTREHLMRIERHVDVADGVITALSNFAKMPNPQLNAMPLEPILREALEINPPCPGVEVVLEVHAGQPAILGDPDQLRIVFGNLIRNACDAMSQGGRLAITSEANDGEVAVSVSDTGVGIPGEQLARIHEPLFSTKARGLGLGLAIVRSILERSQARLRVASEPGRGSTFTVVLPGAPQNGANP